MAHATIQAGCLAACLGALAGCADAGAGARAGEDGCRHVHPGQSIQDAVELAASDPEGRCVKVHAGTYRPPAPRQALIWLNRRHDGISLEAVGEVTLTAANAEVADRSDPSYPAIVNHVVYFGDGISGETSMRGFRITGANGFVTRSRRPAPIEPSTRYPRNLFFFGDGGAIKIFGESYPTLEDLEIHDNYASPCAGGISVQHPPGRRGPDFDDATAVHIRNCVFRANRARVTGSAVDLLWGSAAAIENCLFTGNVSNTGEDPTVPEGGRPVYDAEHGCGALTLFQGSRVRVSRCTFTGNYNGIDDMSAGNTYTASIFWNNTATGGIAPGERYELALVDGTGVEGCFIAGAIPDLRGTVDRQRNTFDAPDPDFDDAYRPRNPAYATTGYRAGRSRAP